MLEAVLMRTFLMLYSSDYDGDDDRIQYKPGKSMSSERRSFTVLSSVCWCWWKTLSGWPESPTGHWVRHQLRKIIKRECTLYSANRNHLLQNQLDVFSCFNTNHECDGQTEHC